MINSKFIQILVIFFAFLLFLVSPTPLGKKKPFNRKRILISGRPWYGMKPVLNLAEEDYPGKGNAVAKVFLNKVNHFNTSSTEKYEQRYWYNSKFYKKDGPVFLMLGGESPESPIWVSRENFEWTLLAKDYGAMLFLLEHRYYGYSRPTKDMTTRNMQYLSSRQAIEDVAAFIRGMNEQFNYTDQTRWVLFGAVGSSGTVQAEVDFYQYLDIAKNSLSAYSSQCSSDLEKGMKELEAIVKTQDGERNITNLFNLCTHWSKLSHEDKEYFWLTVLGTYIEIIQYSGANVGHFRTDASIPTLCKFHMDSKQSPMQHIANVVDNYGDPFRECLDVSYKEFINYLKNTSFDSEAASDRSWMYQQCTEFGYYKSTDYDAGKFWGRILDANWYVRQCTDIFGPSINNRTVYSSVYNTNSYYGGTKGYRGTNVIFPNGLADPWYVLGVLNRTNERNYPVNIEGTSHCADMYTPSPDDLPSLTRARKIINDTLAQILA
uniref:Putative serine protease K12H4.7 (projected from Caenorhabditis elegans ortholog K12H4.7) n=1 Tax=Strongyloides venezuelensis TaxID=75913 RepID=A0A0K0FFZ2_STRVS